MPHDNARPVVVARTIADGKKYIAETPSVPVNALVVVCAGAMQGLRISELHWAPDWELRRSPEQRHLIETSARARLTAPTYEGTIMTGLINVFPCMFRESVTA